MPSHNDPPADPALLVEWARDRLRKAVPTAIRSITELAEDADSEQVKLQASKDVLGLVGLTQKQQVEVDHGVKASQEEVDHELQKTLERLEASRRKALGAGPMVEDSIVANPEEEKVPVESPSEEAE